MGTLCAHAYNAYRTGQISAHDKFIHSTSASPSAMSSPAVASPSESDLDGEAHDTECRSSSDLYEQARSAYKEVRENDPEAWSEFKSTREDMEGTLADGDI